MLDEFLAAYRRALNEAAAERLRGLRACNSLDDLRRGQGYLDGLERARLLFDDSVRKWETDDGEPD